MSKSLPNLALKTNARMLRGHDWVMAHEIARPPAADTPDGAVVTVADPLGRKIGSALWNSRSKIVARRFSRRLEDASTELFVRRLAAARAFREKIGADPQIGRVFWSESDGLPGVIVDRYNDVLVLQTLTLGMDQRLPSLVAALEQVFAPRAIIERNDAPSREGEGLERRTGLLAGVDPGEFEVVAGGIRYVVDLVRGHKTGLYLDQTHNWQAVARWASGRRVLDCFSNQGGFALAAARAGATEVEALEASADCCAQIGENATRNGVAIRVRNGDVFELLPQLHRGHKKYDLVVLDPPTFTRGRAGLDGALAGYKELHLRTFDLLPPGGLLATFACAHHATRERFLSAITDAADDAQRTLRILERYDQAPDHPVLTAIPETDYLKGFLFEVTDGR